MKVREPARHCAPASHTGGVGGGSYVICNRQGMVLRRFPTMTQETADLYASCIRHLAWKARCVVRDLNPQVTPIPGP